MQLIIIASSPTPSLSVCQVFEQMGGMRALGGVWHDTCFVCTGCDAGLGGGFFPSKDAQPVRLTTYAHTYTHTHTHTHATHTHTHTTHHTSTPRTSTRLTHPAVARHTRSPQAVLDACTHVPTNTSSTLIYRLTYTT